MMNTEPIMTVIRRPNLVHSQSPMNEQKIAGRKSEAVMIPSRLPFGVPKYLNSAWPKRRDIRVPRGNSLYSSEQGLIVTLDIRLVTSKYTDIRGKKGKDSIPCNVRR